MTMPAQRGIFAVKLNELEQEYSRTLQRLRLCQREDHPSVRRELQQVWQEYQSCELQMQKSIRGSRSPAVAALSAAQLEYDLQIQHILQEELPGYLHGENTDGTQDQAEAASLYGEYAIDFTAQAMRHALLAALSAIDLQMSCDEKKSCAAAQTHTEGMPNE